MTSLPEIIESHRQSPLSDTERELRKETAKKSDVLVNVLIGNTDLPALAADSTEEDQLIKQLKGLSVQANSDNWVRFFLEWRAKSVKNQRETIERLEKGFQMQEERAQQSLQMQQEKAVQLMEMQKYESERVIDAQKVELDTVKSKMNKITGQLTYLQDRELDKQLQERLALERKAKYHARKRKPLRDAATAPELVKALEVVEKRNYHDLFVKSRDIVTLLILYVTGVRISNVLHCTVNNLMSLLNRGTFSLPAIKTKGNREIRIPITATVQELALNQKVHIEKICEGKEGNQKVFTSRNSDKVISRSLFDQRINNILKETSKLVQKNITSHSFRIGQITNLIQIAGVHGAQSVIGHRDIRTTNLYGRGNRSLASVEKIYKQLDKAKAQKISRRWEKRKSVGE